MLPERLKKGDKVAVVSLSSGILGEEKLIKELLQKAKKTTKICLM